MWEGEPGELEIYLIFNWIKLRDSKGTHWPPDKIADSQIGHPLCKPFLPIAPHAMATTTHCFRHIWLLELVDIDPCLMCQETPCK